MSGLRPGGHNSKLFGADSRVRNQLSDVVVFQLNPWLAKRLAILVATEPQARDHFLAWLRQQRVPRLLPDLLPQMLATHKSPHTTGELCKGQGVIADAVRMTVNLDFNFGFNVSCTGYGNEGVNSGGWDSQDSREGYTHIYL